MTKFYILCLVALALIACADSQITAPHSSLQSGATPSGEVVPVRKVNTVPEGGPWYKLQFVNERDGWLADGKNLWRTSDGGLSWETVFSIKQPKDMPPQVPAYRLKEFSAAFDTIGAFQFVNASKGFLRTSGGLQATEDGGKTWLHRATPLDPAKGTLEDVKFLSDGKTGWIAGGVYRPAAKKALLETPKSAVSPDGKSILYGAVFRTEDGGMTWSQQLITEGPGELSGLYFTDAEHVWAIGDAGVFYTVNGGLLWKASEFKRECANTGLSEEDEAYPVDVFFLDGASGWLSFRDAYLAKSADGGRTWCDMSRRKDTPPEKSGQASFQKIYFADQTRGWGLTADGSLFETKDGGATWVKADGDSNYDDMYFLDPGHGWLVSKAGLFRIAS
jgi:photosystem II stability/assembly factor-like uncharacterized protein